MRALLLLLLLAACDAGSVQIVGPGFAPANEDPPPVGDTADDRTVDTESDGPAPIDDDNDGVEASADCDDTNAAIYPGAPELCDGVDQNCDGTPDEGDACPCPVRNRDGALYQFCDMDRTWSVAATFCADTGMHLVTIDDNGENNWVTAKAKALSSGFQEGWWIGLNDQAAEGQWVWVNGSSASYRKWSILTTPAAADCASLSEDFGGYWIKEICDTRKPFICEL